MKLIYLSILTIALSFSMNTFAENPKVNMYIMDKTEQAKKYVGVPSNVICAEGYMFLSLGWGDGKAVVQMLDENGKGMKCPSVYKE